MQSTEPLVSLSEHTISALGAVITGDGNMTPYRSGLALVRFFNQFGRNDQYGEGFPSRWYYAEECIRELNAVVRGPEVIVAALDRRHFLGTELNPDAAAEHLNQYLELDGYKIRTYGRTWQVVPLAEKVDVPSSLIPSGDMTHDFLAEQIRKCTEKLQAEDYDGAITNARSMVEATLISLEKKLVDNPPDYDGNLPKLYRRVQKELNLTPGQEGLADSLRQILSGLTSIANGLAALRNTMSDSHVVAYRPARHHAQLAVNTSRTLARFLFETYEYQVSRQKKTDRA